MPKRLHWRPMTKFKLKNTFFIQKGFEATLNKCKAELDYELLKEAFCKREEEIK